MNDTDTVDQSGQGAGSDQSQAQGADTTKDKSGVDISSIPEDTIVEHPLVKRLSEKIEAFERDNYKYREERRLKTEEEKARQAETQKTLAEKQEYKALAESLKETMSLVEAEKAELAEKLSSYESRNSDFESASKWFESKIKDELESMDDDSRKGLESNLVWRKAATNQEKLEAIEWWKGQISPKQETRKPPTGSFPQNRGTSDAGLGDSPLAASFSKLFGYK